MASIKQSGNYIPGMPSSVAEALSGGKGSAVKIKSIGIEKKLKVHIEISSINDITTKLPGVLQGIKDWEDVTKVDAKSGITFNLHVNIDFVNTAEEANVNIKLLKKGNKCCGNDRSHVSPTYEEDFDWEKEHMKISRVKYTDMHLYDDISDFRATTRHEIGHVFGLGDAYFEDAKDESGKRLLYMRDWSAPENSVMVNCGDITAHDLGILAGVYRNYYNEPVYPAQ